MTWIIKCTCQCYTAKIDESGVLFFKKAITEGENIQKATTDIKDLLSKLEGKHFQLNVKKMGNKLELRKCQCYPNIWRPGTLC